ncbi:MAG: hypothetical protein U1C71_05015, partial [archaeon]|nr:hypothetical protein [archaeon]
THIDNTGEIGFFKILRVESVQDGIERITFATGVPALEWVQAKEEKLGRVVQILNTTEQDVETAAQKMREEYKNARKKAEGLQAYYLEGVSAELKTKVKGSKLVERIRELEPDALLKLGQMLINQNPTLGIVLVSESEKMVIAMSGSASTFNAKNAIQTILSHTKGSGGGSEKMGQARLQSLDGLDAALMRV